MARYESNVKQLYSSQSAVYAKLSDLNNLSSIKERVNDPMVVQQIKNAAAAQGQDISDEKIQQIRQVVEGMEFDADSVLINTGMMGNISLRIVEREPEKCVKYSTDQSPVPCTLWIQVLPTTETTCKMRVTLDAELNFFMKQMLGSKLKDGIDKFADMLAMIPY